MTDRIRAIEGLALVAALTAVFDGVHALGDQVVQNSHDAMTKGMHGSHLVYKNDGSPVEENPWRHGKEGRTCTASAYGRRSVGRHVASYSAVQLASTLAVTRTLGYRVPASALLTGAAINAITHGILDRREPAALARGEGRQVRLHQARHRRPQGRRRGHRVPQGRPGRLRSRHGADGVGPGGAPRDRRGRRPGHHLDHPAQGRPPVTPAARTRLERVRASAGIAKLAVQQIEDELGGPIDADLLAETLRELFDEADPKGGVLGSLNQLLTTASRAAALTPLDGEDSESAACAIDEAAAFLLDSAGMRLHLATSTLHPQGERP